MRPWRQAKPGSKVTSGLKPVGVWNERLYGGRDDHSNARYRYQPPHVLVTFCLNDNRPLELVDPLPRPLNLIGKFAESEAPAGARCTKQTMNLRDEIPKRERPSGTMRTKRVFLISHSHRGLHQGQRSKAALTGRTYDRTVPTW